MQGFSDSAMVWVWKVQSQSNRLASTKPARRFKNFCWQRFLRENLLKLYKNISIKIFLLSKVLVYVQFPIPLLAVSCSTVWARQCGVAHNISVDLWYTTLAIVCRHYQRAAAATLPCPPPPPRQDQQQILLASKVTRTIDVLPPRRARQQWHHRDVNIVVCESLNVCKFCSQCSHKD